MSRQQIHGFGKDLGVLHLQSVAIHTCIMMFLIQIILESVDLDTFLDN